jgi:hypothetical protein
MDGERLRKISIAYGLLNSEQQFDAKTYLPIVGDCLCHSCVSGRKGISETTIASRAHPWPAVNRSIKGFYKDTMQSVTKMETEILEALGLPSINETRIAALTNEQAEGRVWTRWDRKQETALEDAVAGHLNRMLGEPWDTVKGVRKTGNPIYRYWQMRIMVNSADKVFDLISGAKGHPSMVTMIAPDPEMHKFRAMQQVAGTRIRTEIALKNLPKVKEKLNHMALAGEYPMDVARHLHKELGEGKSWYWARITRTEATLASNLAYDLMAEENNVLYDEWAAGADACLICMQFDQQVWNRDEGPVPVDDTHPHCMCVRIPAYTPPRGDISERWERGDPYGQPYTQEELDEITEKLSTHRRS